MQNRGLQRNSNGSKAFETRISITQIFRQPLLKIGKTPSVESFTGPFRNRFLESDRLTHILRPAKPPHKFQSGTFFWNFQFFQDKERNHPRRKTLESSFLIILLESQLDSHRNLVSQKILRRPRGKRSVSSSKRLFKKLVSRFLHLMRMLDVRLNTKNLRNIIADPQADNLNTSTLQILFDISQKFGIGTQTVRDQKDNFAGLSSTDKLSRRWIDGLSDWCIAERP